MTASTNHIPYGSKSLGTYPADYSYSKTLSTGSNKSLAGSMGADPAVAAWVEQNRYVFDAIMAGGSGLSPQEESQFMDWWNWAMSQLQGAGQGWDPSMGGGEYPAQGQPVPAGSFEGTSGNIVWDNVEVNLIHSDDTRPQDVWAEEFSLDISSMSCEVTAEYPVMDTRTNPAEEVTKITVKNKATGVETVYYLHGDVKATVNTANEGMFVDKSGGKVINGEYTGESGGTGATGVTGGETEETEANHWTHTGDNLDYIPNKNATETEYHEFYGSTTVAVPADCTIDITQNEKGDLVFTVKNKEGVVVSEGTVIDGFPLFVNHANEKSITIGGNPLTKINDKDGNELTIGFEDLNINGTETTEFNFNFDFSNVGEGGEDTATEQYSAEIIALADFLYGNHDKGTMDQMIAQLQEVFGADYEKAMLNVPAGDKPTFAEWAKANWSSMFNLNNPSEKVIQFLFKADSTLASLFEQVKGQDVEDVSAALQDIQTRLIADLQQLGYCPTAAQGKTGDFPQQDVYGIKIGENYYTLYEATDNYVPYDDHEVGTTAGWFGNPSGVYWD